MSYSYKELIEFVKEDRDLVSQALATDRTLQRDYGRKHRFLTRFNKLTDLIEVLHRLEGLDK